MRCSVKRTGVAGVTVLVVASLAAGGCGNSGSPGAASCLTQHAAAGRAGTAPGGSPDPAAWTLPGGNLANTRDVASSISSSDVSTLGVAWCVPVESTGQARAAGLTDGYSTTPVVVHGVVYTQDMESNVMAIELATGKVLWTHDYSSPNGGPDGVNVAGGVVYAATNHAAVALSAATGRQLWSRTLTGNDREGIDMAPGYDDGTVYISTVPVNPAVGAYLGGGKGILWALNAATGAPEWAWDEVGSLWGNPAINSGGILIELDARTGKLLWKLPVGVHSGHDNDGLLTENATPTSHFPLSARFVFAPGAFGGIETPLAANGSTVFSAVVDLPMPMTVKGVAESSTAFEASISKGTGEMVAVNQDTGKTEWDDKLPSSPYGAATVSNDVVFTTTYSGYLYAFNAATGAILLKTPLSSGANAPVTIDGDYVIAGAGVQGTPGQQQLITALQPRRPRRCDNHAHRTAWLSQSRGPAAGRASGGTTTTSTELVVAGSARLRCFVLACQCDGPGPRQ